MLVNNRVNLRKDDRLRAGKAVEERIEDMGLTIVSLARRAHVDRKTVSSLITGERWPRADVRNRVEAVLEWPNGEIYRRGRDGLESLRSYSDRDLLSELLSRARCRERKNDAAATR